MRQIPGTVPPLRRRPEPRAIVIEIASIPEGWLCARSALENAWHAREHENVTRRPWERACERLCPRMTAIENLGAGGGFAPVLKVLSAPTTVPPVLIATSR